MANIRSFGDINKGDGDEDDQKNNLYTGGEKSGLAVIGGDGGGGGDSMDQAVKLAGSQQGSGSAPGDGTVNVTFYRNGFVIGDGPFRAKNDPANEKFLQEIAQGFVPAEIQEASGSNADVDMALVDKRGEDYPEPSYNAFSGSGCSIGSSAPQEGAVVNTQDSKAGIFAFDESQPSTTIQIRTSDGKRVRAKFNLGHTIADIHSYLAKEGAASSAYMLLSGFPPKPLTDQTLTIEAAGLKMGDIKQVKA